MGRPKKYTTRGEKIRAKKQYRKNELKRVAGKIWRLVIPHIEGYGESPEHGHPGLESLKAEVLAKIRLKEGPRGLEKWCVAWQKHPTNGLPHLDILLIYQKRIKHTLNRFDYALKHGNLTKYKKLNRAILQYGCKEDPSPLSNIDVDHALKEQQVRESLYSAMQRAMVADPFGFNPIGWLNDNDLFRAASKANYTKSIRMIRDRQSDICHKQLLKKPGFRQITRSLVEQRLSPEQLEIYDSWKGYQTIVDHLNQIPRFGFNRPHKTSNLLLVGRPNIGKTTLCRKIRDYCASYPIGIKGGWWPFFKDHTYTVLDWQEFNLGVYDYTTLLTLLQGQSLKLPIKGGHVMKSDNPLIIMTSNKSLASHIDSKFYQEEDRCLSRLNLKPRITEVIVPEGRDLFILLKLIISKVANS